MPFRTTLTSEQRLAICHDTERLLVVAAPGCGKTTMAAERYGLLRYGDLTDGRRCLGLSFTRAATGELQRRIRSRWGPSAIEWPHRTMTLDALHVELLESLLRSGHLTWRTGATNLTVEDSWRGQAGARWVTSAQYAAQPGIKSGVVIARSVRHEGLPTTRIGRVADLRQHFASNRCTHVEVREILGLAVVNPDLANALKSHLSSTTRAIVVDEIFDGNRLDVQILRLAAEAGISVAAVGDPWQAVYEFRGAEPGPVLNDLRKSGFDRLTVLSSFRFKSDEMKGYARRLRSNEPCSFSVGIASNCSVVLATEWEFLWSQDAAVLPLSFGTVRNQTDAAILILLDAIVAGRLGRRAVYLSDALAFLRLPADVDIGALRTAAADVIAALSAEHLDAASLLDRWRQCLVGLGAEARLRKLGGDAEDGAIEKLRLLANRMAADVSVPGMTVHQAKGGEWDVVGLSLSEEQCSRLEAGLNPVFEDDRVLYVAATRARHSVVRLQ